ncbi:MAG TPA: tetratricopeptide repeat protein [Chloroflexia bacterium]|nr:tetratricopeptide repeat protein [Chloroflexia bacterium]
MTLQIPRFEPSEDQSDELANFVCLLRRAVFYSRDEAAAHFQLNPSTVTSYESGRIKQVPAGYLAGLALLLLQKYAARNPPPDISKLQSQLLQELNKAIKASLKKTQPLQSWAALQEIARDYLQSQHHKRAGTGVAASEASAIRPDRAPEQVIVEQSAPEDLPRPRETTPSIPKSAPETVPPNNLHQPLTNIIGREKALAEIRSMLKNHRLVTLTGPGGTGKTRLALELASMSLADFSGGVWLVELAPLSRPEQLEQAVAEALGLREQTGQTLLDSLLALLKEKSSLLVLDNCEHLVEASARLAARLLKTCPRLVIVATSRESLNISGEQSYPVPALELPDSGTEQASKDTGQADSLTTLADYPAISLFMERARSVRPDLELTRQNAATILEICRRLDGLPLAIELAAARTRAFTLDKLLERLSLKLLAGGARDLPARQQTLKSAIDWSYELLSENEQRLFEGLGIFAAGFTLEAAEAVCQELTGEQTVIEGLESLVVKNMLKQQFAGESTESRYSMLQTIQEYALEKLEAGGAAARVALNYAHYYLEWAEKQAEALSETGHPTFLNALDSEYPNLRAVMNRTLAEAQPEIAMRIATALNQHWHNRGYYTEGRYYLENALRMAGESVQASYRAHALVVLGWLYLAQGNYTSAEVYLKEGLELGQVCGAKKAVAEAFNGLGGIHLRRAEYNQARHCFEESLAGYREAGNQISIATELHNLGVLLSEMEEFEEASRLFEETLVQVSHLEAHRLTGNALNNLAIISERRGNYEQAIDYVQAGLRAWRRLNNKAGIAVSLGNLSISLIQLGDYPSAKEAIEESLAFRGEIGDRLGIAYCFYGLGLLALLSERNYKQAAKYFEESLDIGRTIGDKVVMGNALNGLGYVALAQERYIRAGSYFVRALFINRELTNRKFLASSLVGLATLVSQGWNPHENMAGSNWKSDPYPEMATRIMHSVEIWLERGGTKLEPMVDRYYRQQLATLSREAPADTLPVADTSFTGEPPENLVFCANYLICALRLSQPEEA